MEIVLTFAALLLLAVLVSALAQRTILSTSVLFLVAGFVLGGGVLGVIPVRPTDPKVILIAQLALFSILFTDGMRVGVRDLALAWRLPGRALLLGMPLNFVLTALLGHLLLALSWRSAFLIGAVLGPTDPVFAAAIVGREDVPARLRHLLNVESGLNDGLALPIVVILLALASETSVHGVTLLAELVGGVIIGVIVPGVAIRLEASRLFNASPEYEPINAVAIGMLVFAMSALTHANLYLAGFASGITIATVGPAVRDAFHRFGEIIAELLKLLALLMFGALITPRLLQSIGYRGLFFVILAIVAARPIALGLALVRSRLSRRERLAAAWFGPRGFASVIYGLLVLNSQVPGRERLFAIVAAVIAGSIVAHSSTDVVVARSFRADPAD